MEGEGDRSTEKTTIMTGQRERDGEEKEKGIVDRKPAKIT